MLRWWYTHKRGGPRCTTIATEDKGHGKNGRQLHAHTDKGTTMNTRRPANCNSVARHRFDASTPTTYVAMYDDGSYGPERETREEAEQDYADMKQGACPFLVYRTQDLEPTTAYHACRNYYGWR